MTTEDVHDLRKIGKWQPEQTKFARGVDDQFITNAENLDKKDTFGENKDLGSARAAEDK